MTSLLHNTKRPVHFHVLENRLSEANKQILCNIGRRYRHGEWTFYHVENDERFLLHEDTYLTVETYFRLYLPELLSDLDKILWIDGDTVIDKDIAELYNIELGNKFAAVGIHVFYKGMPLTEIEIEAGTYFNAGVMLLNLLALREFDLLAQSIQQIPLLFERFKAKGLIFYADQEVLNYLLRGKYLAFPMKFNSMLFSVPDAEYHTPEQYIEAWQNPVIIHYGGERLKSIAKLSEFIALPYDNKPIELYYKYKNLTYFADVKNDTQKISRFLKLNDVVFSFLTAEQKIHLFRKKIILESANIIKQQNKENKKIVIWGVNNKFIRYVVVLLACEGIKVSLIVDGLPENRLESVFGLTVNSPDVLIGKNGEYFVMMSMQSQITADRIKMILCKYGYGDDDFFHLYAPAYCKS
jgi:lipopolysaccharide biosynthesis glycosyltransferase